MLLLCIAKVLNSWTNSNNTIIMQGKHIHKHNEFTASLAGSHIPLRSYSALCLWCTLASPESSALSRHAASRTKFPCIPRAVNARAVTAADTWAPRHMGPHVSGSHCTGSQCNRDRASPSTRSRPCRAAVAVSGKSVKALLPPEH